MTNKYTRRISFLEALGLKARYELTTYPQDVDEFKTLTMGVRYDDEFREGLVTLEDVSVITEENQDAIIKKLNMFAKKNVNSGPDMVSEVGGRYGKL